MVRVHKIEEEQMIERTEVRKGHPDGKAGTKVLQLSSCVPETPPCGSWVSFSTRRASGGQGRTVSRGEKDGGSTSTKLSICIAKVAVNEEALPSAPYLCQPYGEFCTYLATARDTSSSLDLCFMEQACQVSASHHGLDMLLTRSWW